MAESDAGPGSESEALNLGARIEDALHRWRERRGRRRGLKPTIVPYTGYGTPEWTRVLCRVLLTKGGDAPRQRAEKVRGWRSFFSISIDEGNVTITADGGEQRAHPIRGGVVDVRLETHLPPGWNQITLQCEGSDPVFAAVFIVDPHTRFGIVSDIDDTVMVTALPRPFLAAWNTFVLDEHARAPVPGMAVLYERLTRANPSAPVIYLSTGAWNAAPTLTRFLRRNLYPRGPMLLTDWGPTRDRWFRSGPEHKRSNLARLATEFPDVKWLLVGDDGQHDEEIYGAFAAEHPDSVAAIAIRQLSTGEAVFAGGRSRAAEYERQSNVRWFFGQNGAELWSQLAELVTR